MGKIQLTVENVITNGKQISFQAPCNSADATGLIINGTNYDIVNAIGDSVLGIDNVWTRDAMVSIILNTNTNKAYIQNQYDNSPCLAILGMKPYKDESGSIILHKILDNVWGKKLVNINLFDWIECNTNPKKFGRLCDFHRYGYDGDLYRPNKCAISISGNFIFMYHYQPSSTLKAGVLSANDFYIDVDNVTDVHPNAFYETIDDGGWVVGQMQIKFDSIMVYDNGIFAVDLECTNETFRDAVSSGDANFYLLVSSEIILQVF